MGSGSRLPFSCEQQLKEKWKKNRQNEIQKFDHICVRYIGQYLVLEYKRDRTCMLSCTQKWATEYASYQVKLIESGEGGGVVYE